MKSFIKQHQISIFFGEPIPIFDTSLFIVTNVVVALARVIVLVVTKGRLGNQDAVEPTSVKLGTVKALPQITSRS